jgi:hypothetical protein
MTILLLAVTTAADQPDLGRWVALAVLAWLGWLLFKVVFFPNAPCGHCKGTGKHRSGKYWRDCRWCRGKGKKTRFGRRVWNWVTGDKEIAK